MTLFISLLSSWLGMFLLGRMSLDRTVARLTAERDQAITDRLRLTNEYLLLKCKLDS